MHQSLIQCLDCRFIAVKFPFFKENGFIHENLTGRTLKNIAIFFIYISVIRVKMFVLKHWVFMEDIWNFNKWKSLIIDEKCWMLWNAVLREAIILPSK